MGTFMWKMNEANWQTMNKVDASHDWGDGTDFFGKCAIGKMCYEFHHTLDESYWCPYVDSYTIGETCGYGCMSDGTPYDYIDNNLDDSFFAAGTFDEFKADFEREVMRQADEDEVVSNLVEADNLWEKYM